ncbi:MAG TPA: GNAT family N-acetyltransferase [Candidatus Baltobacteraceae bacterium]|jgi:GNAT superfamily N-acetyltransferase|nr:GNAT family N-acetyltransferase [Candidatus Baltobacteraceae bacterium]
MESPDVATVRATLDDVAALTPLFDAYRTFFAGEHDASESGPFLKGRLGAGESVIFLARTAGDVAGFIQLYPLWSSWYCRRIWFLSDLYVIHAHRQRGIGRRLVERAVEHAKETDASSVMVELPHREPHLTKFYASLGFHKDSVFDLARYLI